jgi:hypothetical protein
VIGHELPFPSSGDVLYLAQYPALMLGVILIVRRLVARVPRGAAHGLRLAA